MASVRKKRIPFTLKFQGLSEDLCINSKELNIFLKNYESKFVNAVKQAEKESVHKLSRDIMDDRTLPEYLYDLCEGWIMEDLLAWKIQSELKSKGDYKVELQGCEVGINGRTIFFSSKQVSSKSDLKVVKGEKIQKVDIQFANKERVSYDIKETKIRQTQKEKAVILVYSLPMKKGFILNPKTDLALGQLWPNSEWGGKLVYNFKKDIIAKNLGFVDIKELAVKIQKLME